MAKRQLSVESTAVSGVLPHLAAARVWSSAAAAAARDLLVVQGDSE
jgi:hypothetical protein